MCGIAGILDFTGCPIPPGFMESMTARLAHRGPDGDGVMSNENVALGHRRLSIIDLEGGSQPMTNEDGRVAVTFNGEIYNYRELSALLKAEGHVFRSRSDTETIVHAWEQWGTRCVERLRGMFAFAVADWHRKQIFLARDHLGIKPLYYMIGSDRLVFASEMQAFKAVPERPLEIDLQSLDQYLEFLYIPAPRTIFRRISKLPPAHFLSVSFDGRSQGPQRYWKLEFHPQPNRPIEEWTNELESVLRESVEAHLSADVPFGAFLSGGMDSTAVVGWMSQLLDRPVRTFSIGFEEQSFDELTFARQASDRWQTEHQVEMVRPDALAILPKLVSHYGEPFGDSSAIPTFYVSRLARTSVPMVLSGDGGDEAFAGYKRYHRWLQWLKTRSIQRPLWKKILKVLRGKSFPTSDLCSFDNEWKPDLNDWLRFSSAMGQKFRLKLWRPEYRQQMGSTVHPFKELFPEMLSFPAECLPQYMDYQTYLPFDILTKVDVASMIHGLEVRTPLVDVRVAEFAATIPADITFGCDKNGKWHSKRLLRRILLKYFTYAFIDRPKMGFSVPIKKWFAPSGALRQELEERLLHRNAKIHEYFDPTVVAKLVHGHGDKKNMAKSLWQLLFLEYWLKAYERDSE